VCRVFLQFRTRARRGSSWNGRRTWTSVLFHVYSSKSKTVHALRLRLHNHTPFPARGSPQAQYISNTLFDARHHICDANRSAPSRSTSPPLPPDSTATDCDTTDPEREAAAAAADCRLERGADNGADDNDDDDDASEPLLSECTPATEAEGEPAAP